MCPIFLQLLIQTITFLKEQVSYLTIKVSNCSDRIITLTFGRNLFFLGTEARFLLAVRLLFCGTDWGMDVSP